MLTRNISLFLTCVMLISFTAVFQTIAATEEEMRAAMQGLQDAINAHDMAQMGLYWTDDIVYDFVPQSPPLEGKEQVAAFFGGLFQGFPDFHGTKTRVLVSGNIMVTETFANGTHLGEFQGIPATGSKIQGSVLHIWEFEGDKIKRATEYADMASILVQLGVMPPPEPLELVPSFTLPDAEPTGLSPVEAHAECISRLNTHDLSLYAKIIHPDAEILAAGIPMNRDAEVALEELYLLAFPDVYTDLVRSIDMGDGWVVNELVFTGTNDGPYLGIPATGNSITLRGVALTRYDADGLQTNLNLYFDNLTMLAQLGLIPPLSEPPEGYDNVFFMHLSPGLNMISVPLEPVTPFTARSLAEEVGSTVVIRYDTTLGRFVGFTPVASGDGFPLNGGEGYIVNVPTGGTVAFTGAAWTNEPPVEAAPPVQTSDAWAFVVSGSVLDGDIMSASDGDYTAVVKSLRTGEIYTEPVEPDGYFAAAWADLSRKAVVGAGDKVEVAVMDSSGSLVSGPFIHDITLDSIRNAVMNVHLKLGDTIPAESALLQNYPNPFNPETWIPYHLSKANPVILKIYSASGQLIRTLDLGHKDAGIYTSRSEAAYWDGRNEAGEAVASGVYFYSLNAGGDLSATRKMTVKK